MSSFRATEGFKTKGSRAEVVTPTEYSGSNTLKKYDQGVYVNDISNLIDPATVRMRPNNDFLKIKNGVSVQITEGSFDDTESPTSLVWVSGSVGEVYQKSYIPISFFDKSHPQGGKGSGYAIAPSHFSLDNDFGQPDIYQDGASYEEITTKIDPIVIIETDPEDLFVPFHVVNAADQTSMDGLVDVFDTRKKVNREFEIPFTIRGTRGDLGIDDTYRRSILLTDQTELLSVRDKGDGATFKGTDAFLDASDDFGIADVIDIDPALLVSASKSPEGYVKPPEETVTPFVERNDRELVFDSASTVGDVEMRTVVQALTGSGYFPTHDYLGRNYISLSHGYDYDIGGSRIDSRAFGGLIK